MITEKHHGFFAVFVSDINHFLSQLGYLTSLESLEIQELFGRNPVVVVHIALVDDELRAERITGLLLELF